MNRPIKFRGITTDTRKWVEGDLMHGVGPKHGQMFIHPIQSVIADKECHHLDGYNVIPESVGMFTGLFDKDGREIWEGDRLRWISSSPFSLGEPRDVQVSYIEARYWCQGKGFGVYLAEALHERCKITGTIHDHLLKPQP